MRPLAYFLTVTKHFFLPVISLYVLFRSKENISSKRTIVVFPLYFNVINLLSTCFLKLTRYQVICTESAKSDNALEIRARTNTKLNIQVLGQTGIINTRMYYEGFLRLG